MKKRFVLHIEEFSCQDHADHSKFIPFSITQKKKKQKQKNIATFTPPARKVQNHSIIFTSWNILKMWNESMNQWLVKLRYWSTPAVSQSSGKSLVASLVGKNKHPSTCCEWTNGVWRVDLEAFAASITVSPEKGTEIWIGNASEPTNDF